MADEASYRLIATVVKGELSERFDETFKADMSGSYIEAGIQNVGTAYEALDVGDVTTPGSCLFQNLDSTNFVEIGREIAAAFQAFAKIEPGEFAGPIKPASGVTWYVKADTAAVALKKFIPST